MACVLPDEILVSEIFMKLTASCIVKLRSVCRTWHRLTSEPSFIYAHTRMRRRADADCASAEPTVYQLDVDGCMIKDGELHLLKLDAHDDDVVSTFKIRTAISGSSGSLRLEASCDGLLCFQPDDEEEYKPYIYVCNPVTRIWMTIATSARDYAVSQLDRRQLRDHFLCGFYFHRPTGKYRLLHYSSNSVEDRPPLFLEGTYEVATVGGEDKSWRSICELRLTEGWNPAKDMDGAEALAVFGYRELGSIAVNGSLHWLHSIAADKLGVVVFDTESEKFSRISAPVGRCDHVYPPDKLQMNKIRGNLCLGRITEVRYGEEMMELWMLKDYKTQQWVKLNTIQPGQQGFMGTVPPQRGDEEVDGELLVRWGMYSFGLYNFKLKTYKLMKNTTFNQKKAFYRQDLIYYTESLIDPRSNPL